MIQHSFTDLKNVSGIQTFVASVIVRYLILSAQAKTTFIIGFLDSGRGGCHFVNPSLSFSTPLKTVGIAIIFVPRKA
jgi:hypothetical protein